VANELTKTPAIIITEELGSSPQNEMISDVGKSELRHRIKQTPFKALERVVEDKALERGSKLFRVSSYRNSRVCPIHFTRLEGTNDWHTLQCPLGHYVHRDYASVANMMWKVTSEAWTKSVWWNMKREMNWREYEGESNPLIPYEIVKYIHAVLKTFTASEESPAMPARAKPMNPAGGANEGWARETRPDSMSALYDGKISKDEFTKLYEQTEYEQGKDDIKRSRGLEALARAAPQTHTHGA